jgi:uncharacterized membrane protein YccC
MPASSTPSQGAGLFLWHELLALVRLDWVPEKWRFGVSFAIRNWLACMLALYLAFFLQLDEPYWAGLTVWILGQPTPGMAISRSFYRIIGTVIGSTMGVVQTPELFVIALGLWIGACTVASNLLRNFRAYGAVLAGYTAAIISLAAFQSPNQVFDIAMARASATFLGIACGAVAASLFSPHKAHEKVMSIIRGSIQNFARRCAFPYTGAVTDRIALGSPLVNTLIALDAEIGFAAAESPDFRIHVDLARSLVAHLFGGISAKRSLEAHLIRTGLVQDQLTVAFYHKAVALLEQAPKRIDDGQWQELESDVEALRFRLQEHSPETADRDLPQAISSRLVLDRLDNLLRHFGRALHDWRGLQGGYKWEASLTLNFHRDQRAAWINGTRAFLAVAAAGTFWIASAWSSGSFMLIQVGVACSLFSAAPNPDVLGFTFLRGALYATVPAFFCTFFLLQNIDGFVLLSLVFGLCLLPMAIRVPYPATVGTSLSYCVYFFALVRPLNPMQYDVSDFLNNTFATIIGLVFGVLPYQLFMPPNPSAARRYVVRRIRQGLRNISQMEPIPPACIWQTRMFDRVNRLYDPANLSGTRTEDWFEGGMGALDFGNDVLALRMLLQQGKLRNEVSTLLHSILTSFDHIVKNPDSTRFTIQAVGATLQGTPPPENAEGRRAWYRTLGILGEMEAFFLEHPRFLQAS